MKRRFPGASERDVVEVRRRREVIVEFRDDPVCRDVFAPLAGEVGRLPALAVDAVESAGLVRHQVDPERDAKAPGGDRAEEVTVCHGVILSTLRHEESSGFTCLQ